MDLAPFPAKFKSHDVWKQDNDPVQPYIATEDLLTSAQKNSVIDGLPMDLNEADDDQNKIRGAIAAERLWLLGYLDCKNKRQARATYDSNRQLFCTSLSRFQKECELKPDGWLGTISWQALEDLVAFENDQLNPAWLKGDPPLPLLRAAQCRLFVLGLSNTRPNIHFNNLDIQGIRRFNRVIALLSALPLSSAKQTALFDNTKLNEESLRLLLDQDSLLEAINKNYYAVGSKKVVIRLRRKKQLSSKKNKQTANDVKLINALIIRMVQIELWLRGYQITLSKQAVYKVDGFDDVKQRDAQLKKALNQFSIDIQKQQARWRLAIGPELINLFCKLKDSEITSEIDEDIQQKISTEADVERALREGRSGGLMRLFDGIKRSIKSFWGLIKRTARKVKEWAKQISRFFYHKVVRVFDVVRTVISMVAQSFASLDGSLLKLDDAVVQVRVDGDHNVLMNAPAVNKKLLEEGSLTPMGKIRRSIRLNAKRHVLACKLLTLITSAFKKAVIQSWALLALTLYRKIKEIAPIARELYFLETRINKVF